ncbi:MAG: RNA polymerase-associated protein RapA [Nitrospira sp.]|nr:RNA polymerase-associated protein RapA [Nitrospira sp.]
MKKAEISRPAESDETSVDSPIGFVGVSVSRHGDLIRIHVRASEERTQREGVSVRLPVAEIVVRRIVVGDVRLSRQLQTGRTVQLAVRLAGENGLDTPRPDQTSGLARILRPYFEVRPSLDALFPYQRLGVEWLLRNSNALLADDMGLGKTAQVLSALRLLVHEGGALRILVGCPKSLVRNWRNECARWAPELIAGTPSPELATASSDWNEFFGSHHLAVVNYEKLRHLEVAKAADVDVLVADEAHRIRNSTSGVSVGMRSIRAGRRWAVTGTPIERAADDLATLLAFVDPMRFAPDDARLGAVALRERASAYTLRRTKETVLAELPGVIEHRERIELLPEQRVAYDLIVDGARKDSNVLAAIGRLREVCDADPTTGASAKLDRAREILKMVSKAGEKIIVFSYFLRPLHLLSSALNADGFSGRVGLIEGSLSSEERSSILDRFKSDPNELCLLASTKVASEGLTLTEANHVLFINQWWNPSSNAQARDRVVRIGQKRVVHLYVFTCEDTLEERLEVILTQKGDTYRNVIDKLSEGAHSEDAQKLARALISR